jgi:hypothetical protein
MASGLGERDPPQPPPPLDLVVFQALLSSYTKSTKGNPQSRFVKKLDEIPKVSVHSPSSRSFSLRLAENGLIGQFMGLWPSPREMAQWLEKNWKKTIKGQLSTTFCGKGFYVFLFENKADRDLIFRNGPYFMGTRGMYLNQWTPDFSPENDIPSVVPVWVRLPFLPLHCWNDETIKNIGNTLGRFIDRAEPRDRLQSCARLCVEVDLEKGLPEAIQLTLDGWSYIQTVDYEKLPFKCKACHEYGHFAKNCPKATLENPENKAPEQWQPTKRKKVTNKSGAQQQERKTNTRPSSPIKGKSPMQNNNEAESNKNRYDPLENLEVEMVNSKENTEEIQSQQIQIQTLHRLKSSLMPLSSWTPPMGWRMKVRRTRGRNWTWNS